MGIDEINIGSVQELATLDCSPPDGGSLCQMIGAPETTAQNIQTTTPKLNMIGIKLG